VTAVSDAPACAHPTRADGVCTTCGHCEHDVILNGACLRCGTTELDGAALSPKPVATPVIPVDRLRRK
jgi:hypothetical protein